MIFIAVFGFMLYSVQRGELIVLSFFAVSMAMMLFGIYSLAKEGIWKNRKI